MFEKEAEEYFRDNAHNFDEVTACRECMEFGYNKCFEQIRKIVNEDTRLDSIIPELLRLKESE